MLSNSQILRLQEKLTGALIGLARATDGSEHLIYDALTRFLLEGLAATLPNAGLDAAALSELVARADGHKRQIVPNCFSCAMPCGRTSNYDLENLKNASGDSRTLRNLLLQGLRLLAAYAYPAWALERRDERVEKFVYKALFTVGRDDWDRELLLPVVLELGDMQWSAMALLTAEAPEK